MVYFYSFYVIPTDIVCYGPVHVFASSRLYIGLRAYVSSRTRRYQGRTLSIVLILYYSPPDCRIERQFGVALDSARLISADLTDP